MGRHRAGRQAAGVDDPGRAAPGDRSNSKCFFARSHWPMAGSRNPVSHEIFVHAAQRSFNHSQILP
jgi:hypothetical protein